MTRSGPPSLADRISILEGQMRGLRAHLGDDGRSCHEVAHLVGIIDGGWGKVRAGVLKGYVQECLLDLEGVEEDERVKDLLEAIGRIAAH